MARWYSKQRKKRYSLDIRTRGFIPHYSALMLGAMKPHYSLGGLERCEFDDECDFCSKPRKGTYASICYYAECTPETDFYICGKCAKKTYYKEKLVNFSYLRSYSNFAQYKRKSNLKENEFICAWCDEVANHKCTCYGAKYFIENEGEEQYHENKSH